jgi:UDP:flavonoid glycosyltransferase YjiC (YdhE family)
MAVNLCNVFNLRNQIVKKIKPVNILLSPLNWGIGHASRLVPIAFQLHNEGATIFICAHGDALKLLQTACPYAQFVPDVPFEMHYAKTRTKNIFKILWQMPRMLLLVYREHKLLKRLVQQYHIHAVISDNRYGFYHKSIPSVFITHQLQIQAPFGKTILNGINHFFIKKFKSCWVPDFEDKNYSIAGNLSDKRQLKNVKYIGLLSHASSTPQTIDVEAPILYLLSGIEPQRSLLEEIILKRFAARPHQAIIVRGTTKNIKNIPQHPLLQVYQFCEPQQLQKLANECKLIVARSGYSTIMDVILWKKNAVLIPTPGQFEQEYLAAYLSQKKWFLSIEQNSFLEFNEEIGNNYHCPNLPITTTNYKELLLG